MQTLTTLSKGWFRDFGHENYNEVSGCDVDLVKLVLDDGRLLVEPAAAAPGGRLMLTATESLNDLVQQQQNAAQTIPRGTEVYIATTSRVTRVLSAGLVVLENGDRQAEVEVEVQLDVVTGNSKQSGNPKYKQVVRTVSLSIVKSYVTGRFMVAAAVLKRVTESKPYAGALGALLRKLGDHETGISADIKARVDEALKRDPPIAPTGLPPHWQGANDVGNLCALKALTVSDGNTEEWLANPRLGVEELVGVLAGRCAAGPTFLMTAQVVQVANARPCSGYGATDPQEIYYRLTGHGEHQSSDVPRANLRRLDPELCAPQRHPALARLWELRRKIDLKLGSLLSNILSQTTLVSAPGTPEPVVRRAAVDESAPPTLNDVLGMGVLNPAEKKKKKTRSDDDSHTYVWCLPNNVCLETKEFQEYDYTMTDMDGNERSERWFERHGEGHNTVTTIEYSLKITATHPQLGSITIFEIEADKERDSWDVREESFDSSSCDLDQIKSIGEVLGIPRVAATSVMALLLSIAATRNTNGNYDDWSANYDDWFAMDRDEADSQLEKLLQGGSDRMARRLHLPYLAPTESMEFKRWLLDKFDASKEAYNGSPVGVHDDAALAEYGILNSGDISDIGRVCTVSTLVPDAGERAVTEAASLPSPIVTCFSADYNSWPYRNNKEPVAVARAADAKVCVEFVKALAANHATTRFLHCTNYPVPVAMATAAGIPADSCVVARGATTPPRGSGRRPGGSVSQEEVTAPDVHTVVTVERQGADTQTFQVSLSPALSTARGHCSSATLKEELARALSRIDDVNENAIAERASVLIGTWDGYLTSLESCNVVPDEESGDTADAAAGVSAGAGGHDVKSDVGGALNQLDVPTEQALDGANVPLAPGAEEPTDAGSKPVQQENAPESDAPTAQVFPWRHRPLSLSTFDAASKGGPEAAIDWKSLGHPVPTMDKVAIFAAAGVTVASGLMCEEIEGVLHHVVETIARDVATVAACCSKGKQAAAAATAQGNPGDKKPDEHVEISCRDVLKAMAFGRSCRTELLRLGHHGDAVLQSLPAIVGDEPVRHSLERAVVNRLRRQIPLLIISAALRATSEAQKARVLSAGQQLLASAPPSTRPFRSVTLLVNQPESSLVLSYLVGDATVASFIVDRLQDRDIEACAAALGAPLNCGGGPDVASVSSRATSSWMGSIMSAAWSTEANVSSASSASSASSICSSRFSAELAPGAEKMGAIGTAIATSPTSAVSSTQSSDSSDESSSSSPGCSLGLIGRECDGGEGD